MKWGTLIRATKAEMLTLVNEYHITAPHGATKTYLHNLILDHLLDNDNITSESHEERLSSHEIEDRAFHSRTRTSEENSQDTEGTTCSTKKKHAELQREREKEQLEFQREREREQLELQREREQEALKVRERERELQREHAEKQAAIALENRRKELDLETTHHTQRKEAEANLQVFHSRFRPGTVKHLKKQCGHAQESQSKCDHIFSDDMCKTINVSKVLENLQSSTLAIGTPSYHREMGSCTPATIIIEEPHNILPGVQRNEPSNLLGYNFIPPDFNILQSMQTPQFNNNLVLHWVLQHNLNIL
nr:protein PRRC2C-like [Procambarus clarkii]